MESSRRLATIMFTDIVGYTALMARNEHEAMALLKSNRDLHNPLIEQFGGKFIKEMGDGILASFKSSSEAVICAAAIQKAARQKGIMLRIGVHQGEVIFQDGDVFGDGVNIAARIEPHAEPGQILISEDTYRNISNKPGIKTVLIGKKHLKNVIEARKIYAVSVEQSTLEHALIETNRRIQADQEQDKDKVRSPMASTKFKPLIIGLVSIVVVAFAVFVLWKLLPVKAPALIENQVAVAFFKNETGNASLDYLERMTADRLTQGIGTVSFVEISPLLAESEIDATVQGVERLKLLSGKTGSNIVVSGVFYKEASRLVFQAEVIEMSTGRHLKTLQSISGDVSDPSAIVDELVQRVLSLLAFKFDLPWKTFINYMGNVPTYDAYKEIKEAWEVFHNRKYLEAIDRYERALQLDSTFIHAYLMIGIVFYEGGYPAQADSMVKFLNEIRSDYTLEERKLITWLEAMLYNDLTGYLQVSREIAEFDSDWEWNTGWGAFNLNRLYEAEDWFSQVDHTSSFATSSEAYWAYHAWTLHLHGKYKDELNLRKVHKQHLPQSRYAVVGQMIAQMTLGNVKEAMDMKNDVYGSLEGINPALGLYSAAMEFLVHGRQSEAHELVEDAIKWITNRPESKRPGHRVTLFDALFFSVFSLDSVILGELSSEQTSIRNQRINIMQLLANELVQEEPLNKGYLGRFGVLHAELGDLEIATQAFATLEDLEGPFLHGMHLYWQAAIAAHLGQHAQAVALLYDAQSEGRQFSILFHRHPTWVQLKDHPDFIEFVRPKG